MSARWPSFVLIAICFVAAIAVGSALAELTWHSRGQVVLDLPLDIADAAPPASVPVDLAPILTLAPFGQTVQTAARGQAGPTQIDGLVLRALTQTIPDIFSSAAISFQLEPTQAYRIGDQVRPGILLDAVGGDHVFLDLSGRIERLDFAEPEGATARSAMRQQNARALGSAIPNAGTEPEAVIDFYRRQIAANPQTVLDSFGVSATNDGYRIGARAPIEVRRAGLRPGDIITSVNGNQVGNIESDRGLFETIVASGRARVELRRGDATIVLTFPLK